MLARIYASVCAANRAAGRRTERGKPSVVEFHDDLRDFEGGYIVEDYDPDNPLHRRGPVTGV